MQSSTHTTFKAHRTSRGARRPPSDSSGWAARSARGSLSETIRVSQGCRRPVLNSIRHIWGRISGRIWQDWHWQIASRLTDISRLAGLMKLNPGRFARLAAVAEQYPFCVTPYYFSLCDFSVPRDPVLRQIIPDRRELEGAGVPADPLGERRFEAVPGLIHRYQNRAVVLVTNECAVRCRHCTRKNTLAEFIGEATSRNVKIGRDGSPSRPDIEDRMPRRGIPTLISHLLPAILNYLRRHPQIREVLVSGGDPLMLETAVLDRILGELRAVKTIEVLRIGTRAPVVLPMRIDDELCGCLKKHRPLWLNTQFNHPREITPEAIAACRRLQEAGLPVSNQAVLLRGANDSFAVMAKLCNELQRIMVRPYYVFQCDGVRGTRHFTVPFNRAVKLAKRLRSSLGGLAMPLFVADIPGRKSKVPLETGK